MLGKLMKLKNLPQMFKYATEIRCTWYSENKIILILRDDKDCGRGKIIVASFDFKKNFEFGEPYVFSNIRVLYFYVTVREDIIELLYKIKSCVYLKKKFKVSGNKLYIIKKEEEFVCQQEE